MKKYNILQLAFLIKSQYYRFISVAFYKLFFKSIGKKSRIISPKKLVGTQNITINDYVTINDGAFILTQHIDLEKPNLIFENGVTVGHYCHITCVKSVVISENVLIADRVFIGDNYHSYENITMPIQHQGIASRGTVFIGKNSWIGDGAAIVSCNIGRNCVIGANSVVTNDIPDYSVAVGSPAKVVKRYNQKLRHWEKI